MGTCRESIVDLIGRENITLIAKYMFGLKIKKDNQKNNQDNSKTFFDLPESERIEILKRVAREADKEQHDILVEYGDGHSCAKCK